MKKIKNFFNKIVEFKNSFKKRTPTELAEAIAKGDYTGGYDFKNWVVFNKDARTKEILGVILYILGPIVTACTDNTYNLLFQVIFGIVINLAGLFVLFLNRRTFKRLKNKISD